MFKRVISSALFVGLMTVSVVSNATLLVNHHNQPYREYTRHISHHRPFPHPSHQRQHHRSYVQHSKVVNHCLRMKNGQHYRVC